MIHGCLIDLDLGTLLKAKYILEIQSPAISNQSEFQFTESSKIPKVSICSYKKFEPYESESTWIKKLKFWILRLQKLVGLEVVWYVIG